MSTPDNNPYPNSPPTQNSHPDSDKGSVLAGFFIGWGLMIAGPTICWTIFALLAGVGGIFSSPQFGGFSLFFPLLQLMPLALIIGAMVWFAKKGKSKTVKGIGAAILSAIALVLLLVAACFGLFAMGGSGFH